MMYNNGTHCACSAITKVHTMKVDFMIYHDVSDIVFYEVCGDKNFQILTSY